MNMIKRSLFKYSYTTFKSKNQHKFFRYFSCINTLNSTMRVPPNILIFAENENDFLNLKSYLQSLIGCNSYTIYSIGYNDFTTSNIWMSNCTLLITIEQHEESRLSQARLEKKVLNMREFLNKGGFIISVPSMNEKCNKFSFDNSTKIVNYFGSHFYFEFYYETKCNFKRQICDLNGEELNAKQFFCSYIPEKNNGLHFVSKVIKIRKKKFLVLNRINLSYSC